MPQRSQVISRSLMTGAALLALAACDQRVDWDLRAPGTALDTTEAARQATAARPAADDRGVISYPSYQVAVARRGDTVGTVATRLGLDAGELARYNGLDPALSLRGGEVLALPRRVGAATAAPAAGGAIDITTIAGAAIDRAGSTAPAPGANQPQGTPGREPIRHQVVRGETAYSIARLYNVSARALADWNGLGPDLAVREGQFLLIPVPGEERLAAAAPPGSTAVPAPGAGSPTPEPPSAAKPLPEDAETPAQATATGNPPSPDLGSGQTAASAARFAFPAEGSIIRGYVKRKNDGIDIGAASGAPVRAAADGTVAAITQDTDQVPILVIRHAGNLLTVYANVDGIKVAKGAAVKRGQTIAAVRAGNPSFLHFEVRQGLESVDPMPYLQ